MRRLLLWVLLGCCAQALAEDEALRAIDACRARLDPRTDIGIQRIERRCPELLPALQAAPWRDLLPSTLGQQREDISAESLRTLAELVRRAGEAGPRHASPDLGILDPVLAELGEQGRQGATRWERFKRWLQRKLENRPDEATTGWLEQWSRKLRTSEGVAQAITYLGYALVIALALFVIWSELRAAGLLGGAHPSRRRSAATAEWRRRLMLTDVLAAPLAERPGMLLKLLGEALSRARRLPAPEGLTAAAIAAQARLESAGDTAALASVAATAERIRYAPQAPAEPAIEAAVENARELLGRFARLPVEPR